VDCSVAAKWALPEPDRAAARDLFDRRTAGEVQLIAPDLLLVEFASLLSKKVRRRLLSNTMAKQAFELLERTAPILVETRTRIPAALALSLEHQISFWDAVYVAVAVELDCAFLTADDRLFRSGAARHSRIRRLY
jgi:predicted nucleic acid-binding protein